MFTEIAKTLPPTSEVFFWRSTSGAEVDFVIKSAGRLSALEVKATQAPKKKLTRSTRSFIDAYRPESFCVVQPGVKAQDKVADTKIDWIPPVELTAWLHRTIGQR